jgi:hypothetical protein
LAEIGTDAVRTGRGGGVHSEKTGIADRLGYSRKFRSRKFAAKSRYNSIAAQDAGGGSGGSTASGAPTSFAAAAAPGDWADQFTVVEKNFWSAIMAYTSADETALQAAIASGVLSVNYGGKQITYRGMAELRQALAEVQRALAIADSNTPTRQVKTRCSKGL